MTSSRSRSRIRASFCRSRATEFCDATEFARPFSEGSATGFCDVIGVTEFVRPTEPAFPSAREAEDRRHEPVPDRLPSGWRGRWRGLESARDATGVESHIVRKEPNAQVLCRKNLDFFPDDRQTPARREARNHRSEDAKMLGPPPCGPQRTGRADQRGARGDAHRDRNPQNPRRPVLLCATQRPRSANNKTTTMTRHPELRDPRSDPSDDRSRELARSLVERH